jgi:tetrahydromethanopterin S-methyltransferase subunit G/DNA-directed RNA polymerase subunit RPC12/RpoP
MQELGPTSLVGPVQVRCPYCQAVETLPAEAAQRVVALRARLAGLRAAQEAEEGPAVAYAKMIEGLRSYLWMYAVFGFLIIGGAIASTIERIQKVVTATKIPENVRKELLSSAMQQSPLAIGMIFGIAIGYILALRNYKKAVVPTLRARAPMQPGMPARCRSCGASLPADPTQGAFVQCAHCAAQNLISGDLLRDRVRFLDEETRAYGARGAGVQRRVNQATTKFQTYFFIGGGIGLLLAGVLGLLIQSVFEPLFF